MPLRIHTVPDRTLCKDTSHQWWTAKQVTKEQNRESAKGYSVIYGTVSVTYTWRYLQAKEKYRGMFEIQKSGDKISSGEIGLAIMIKNIFKYLKISLKNWRHFQIIEYMLKRRSIFNRKTSFSCNPSRCPSLIWRILAECSIRLYGVVKGIKLFRVRLNELRCTFDPH